MNASTIRGRALPLNLLLSLAFLVQPGGAGADEPKTGDLPGHVERVNAVAFAPDGRILATGGGNSANGGHDRSVKLWDRSGRVLADLQGHSGPVLSVAFSPDGKTLASAGEDQVVKLWDVAACRELAKLEGHAAAVQSVAFAPDGRTLASGSRDATVRIWDLATRQTRSVLKGHSAWVQGVAFSPDGRTLASANDDATVKLWDVASGRELRTLKGHGFGVWSVAFAPDGKSLTTASMDSTARTWDVASGRELHKLDLPAPGYAVAYSPDGKTLAVATGGSPLDAPEPAVVVLWDTSTWKETRTLVGHLEAIHHLAFAPDGKTLATASSDRTVRLWDPSMGALRLTFKRATHPGTEDMVFMAHLKPIRAVAYAPDGKTVATAGEDGVVKLWDPSTRIDRAILRGHQGKVLGVAYAPDGKLLASTGEDGTLRLWDPGTGRELSVLRGHTGPVLAVAFSPNGQTLASGGDDATIRLWDVAGRKPKAVLARHRSTILAVAFAHDGKTLASSSTDQTVRLWDVDTGRSRETLEGHTQPVVSLAFAPSDGKTLATASPDGTVILWDVAAAKPRITLQGHVGRILALAFAPDGKTLATAGDDTAIRRWDVATGRLVGMRSVLSVSPIVALAYSPDGRVIAAGEQARRVRLWDVGKWLTSGSFSGHNDRINLLAISRDGKALISGSYDRSVRIFNPDDGWERVAILTEGRLLSFAVSPDARTLATVSNTEDGIGGGAVRLWDATTGRELPPLLGDTAHSFAVAIAPDGKTLASAGNDRVISIWDLATHKRLRRLPGHTGTIMTLAFSPDGKTLASAGHDTTVKLWDFARGTPRASLEGHCRSVLTMAFSPDGMLLATGGSDRTVILWDLSTRRERSRLLWQKTWISCLAFSPDGRLLGATAGTSTGVSFWNVATGERKLILMMPAERKPDTFDCIAFTPDGRRLFTGNGIKDILPWSMSDVSPHVKYYEALPVQALATLSGHRDVVLSARFTADGRTLASLSRDGSVKLWDVARRRERATIGGQAYWCRGLALAADGRTLATSVGPPMLRFADPPQKTGFPTRQKVKLWDVSTGKQRAAFDSDTQTIPASVDLSPDGRWLAGSDAEGTTLWDVPTRLQKGRLVNSEQYGEGLAVFSPDGKIFAIRHASRELKLWDVATGREHATLPHADPIQSVQFSPDGKTLAVRMGRFAVLGDWLVGRVVLWDVATGKPRATLRGHTVTATRMVFSPDGKSLATGEAGNRVLLWDSATGALRRSLSGHGNVVNVLAFSTDGTRLASTAFDNVLKVWDLGQGRELASYRGHDNLIESIAFSPDGKLVATASRDNTVMLWDAHPGPAGVPRLVDREPVDRIGKHPSASHAAGVPYRLGVNASCGTTNDDSRAGRQDQVAIIATITRPDGAVENRRSRTFAVGPAASRGSFITGLDEGRLAPGESIHAFLTFIEEDGGLPPAFQDLLAKAGARAAGPNTDAAASALLNGLSEAFYNFPGDADDLLGIIGVTLTCTNKGDLVLSSRPVYEAFEAAPHRLQDAADEGPPRYNRHELHGAGSHYGVESWVYYTQPPPPSTKARIEYMSHVAGIGDTAFVRQQETTGSERESRSMEGLAVRLATGSEAIDLRVKAHVSFQGDTNWVGLGGFVGTRGASLAMQALWMELNGPSADRYDVWYSVRLADCEWMGWVKNGSQAGSTGCGRQIEAVRAFIAEKPR